MNGSNGYCIMPPTAELLKSNLKYFMVYAINQMTKSYVGMKL